MKAARAAQEGARLDEVLEVARRNIGRTETRSTFDTLEYLRRGGRIGLTKAFVGSMPGFPKSEFTGQEQAR